jgi:hypothetical protein
MLMADDIWNAEELVLDPSGPNRVARSLLTGFQLTDGPVRLGPVTIRPSDPQIDQRLQDYGRAYTGTCVLELRYRERSGVTSIYAEPLQLIERVFLATQLAIDAWVGSSVAHHFDEAGHEVGVSGGPRTMTADSWHPDGDPTVPATPALVEALKLAVGAQVPPLSNAIDRFSKGCTNLTNDAIVDFAIVLDALLGFGISNEITHRVASRGAFLLAPPDAARQHRYTSIKYLYGCRSKIVHEASTSVRNPSAGEMSALEAMGMVWERNDRADFNRCHVANLARRTARDVLWKFIDGSARLDADWLTRLELGLA